MATGRVRGLFLFFRGTSGTHVAPVRTLNTAVQYNVTPIVVRDGFCSSTHARARARNTQIYRAAVPAGFQAVLLRRTDGSKRGKNTGLNTNMSR